MHTICLWILNHSIKPFDIIWLPCSCGPTEPCVGDTLPSKHIVPDFCRSIPRGSTRQTIVGGTEISIFDHLNPIFMYLAVVKWSNDLGVWTVRSWSDLERGCVQKGSALLTDPRCASENVFLSQMTNRIRSIRSPSPSGTAGCGPSVRCQVYYESRDHSAKWKHSAGLQQTITTQGEAKHRGAPSNF